MPDIDVVMDVVRHDGRYLVLRKAERYREQRERYAANPWEIPGGKVEGDRPHSEDDIRRAALRELREETGLDGDVVLLGTPYDRTQEEDRTYDITFYPVLLEVETQDVQLGAGMEEDEHDRAAWVSAEEFHDRLTGNEHEAFHRVVSE